MASIVQQLPDGRLTLYSDGSVLRAAIMGHLVPPSSDQRFVHGVATKDVVVDHTTGVRARIFLPESSQNPAHADGTKKLLPLFVYFHGGGFCTGSVTWSVFHNFLVRVARQANAICISVDYRLAPEYRLPSAFDDCFGALKWIQSQQAMEEEGDPWLVAHADFTRCFLAGESAGGNIVHNLALRISGESLNPLRIEGLLIIQPFFMAMEKTQAELDSPPPDSFLTSSAIELYSSLALPIGAKRDYPPCNPWGPLSPNLSDFHFPRVLVGVASKDMLRDLGIMYYEALKQNGKDVQLVLSKDVDHVFHLVQPESKQTALLFEQIVGFMEGQITQELEQMPAD